MPYELAEFVTFLLAMQEPLTERPLAVYQHLKKAWAFADTD